MWEQDTIAAISTPLGEGAIAIIRLSGADAKKIATASFRPTTTKPLPPRKAVLGHFYTNKKELLDQVLFFYFPDPASFTGEEMVEIHCHGGHFLTQKIIQTLLENNARLAHPGEFSKRAFLNGKIDLTQAEGIMDTISARTELALKAANQQREGTLATHIQNLRQELLHSLSEIEADIDFPEENLQTQHTKQLLLALHNCEKKITALLQTAEQGRILREGARVVLCGAPNAGKSSLLNLLLATDRAIVSQSPGTTRDTIEESITLDGIPLQLIDTAGLHHTDDPIETQGIARTHRALQTADIILYIVDGTQAKPQNDPIEFSTPPLIVINKADLGLHPSWDSQANTCPLSCKTQEGKTQLLTKIKNHLTQGTISWSENPEIAINTRHKNALHHVHKNLQKTLLSLQEQQARELTAFELRLAIDALSDITGKLDTEDLLSEIFAHFCIGK